MKKRYLFNSNLIFTFIVIILIIALGIFAYKLRRQTDSYVDIEMIGAGGEWWWRTGPPPSWIPDSISVGDSEMGPDGKINAKIISIRSYEQYYYEFSSTKQFVARISLRAKIDHKRNTITYKGEDIHIGDPLTIKPGNKSINGTITWIDGLSKPEKLVNLEVVIRSYNRYPWFAEAIKKDMVMTDGQGNVIARVKDVSIDLADMAATTATGNILARKNPLMRDVTVTLDIETNKVGDLYYFAYEQPVKVGKTIWFFLQPLNLDNVYVMSYKEI